MLITVAGCRTASERWLSGMVSYAETHSKTFSVEILRIAQPADTSAITYRVRLRPLGKERSATAAYFEYHSDSSFTLKLGNKSFSPAIVQAVPDGIKGCYEYLLSFNIEPAMQLKPLALVYRDGNVDPQTYTLNLNQK